MKMMYLVCVVQLLFLMVGCDKSKADDVIGGWYLISEDKEIIGDMIFNKNDVDEIWVAPSSIDSKNVYNVTGRFTPDATVRLSAFMEQNIGKRFGFVLDGEVITYDIIEPKDYDGRFSIAFVKKTKAQRAYKSLLINYNIIEQ